MRSFCVAVLLCAALSAAPAQAAPVRVAYVVEEHAGSWQPLEPKDLEKTIEHAALEVLTQSGLLQLEARTRKSLRERPADYVLLIEGRTVDEAETHTTYLTFEPGGKGELGSFRAADSAVLSKLQRAAMLSAVEASARKAAAELIAVLKPAVAQGGAGEAAPPKELDEKRELPWRWPEVRVPSPSAARGADGLYSKKSEERMAALRELTSLALTEASPRHALEGCVLRHPDKPMRVGCLEALRPLSRRLEPTQRVVIEAFRKDQASEVKSEATEQMLYFTGLARAEAAQAWLESASRAQVFGPMLALGDQPNLDLAIRGCLLAAGKKEKYQRSKRACIEMTPPLSVERRRRILWRHLEETNPDSPYYLEGAGEREGSNGTDWQWAMEAVLEGATEWDPALEEILWKRYQRTLSSSSLDVLADTAPASQKLVERLLEVVQTAGSQRALFGLRRVAREARALRAPIKEKLAELVATRAYPKTISERQLDEVLKEIARMDAKEQD